MRSCILEIVSVELQAQLLGCIIDVFLSGHAPPSELLQLLAVYVGYSSSVAEYAVAVVGQICFVLFKGHHSLEFYGVVYDLICVQSILVVVVVENAVDEGEGVVTCQD